jgi:hypothetical protein
MVLPTIFASMIASAILGDECPRNEDVEDGWEQTDQDASSGRQIGYTFTSRPTWECLYIRHMKKINTMRPKAQRIVRKYHVPDWIFHYEMAPGMHFC